MRLDWRDMEFEWLSLWALHVPLTIDNLWAFCDELWKKGSTSSLANSYRESIPRPARRARAERALPHVAGQWYSTRLGFSISVTFFCGSVLTFSARAPEIANFVVTVVSVQISSATR